MPVFILENPETGKTQRLAIDRDTIVIGRSPNAEIPLADTGVSKRHLVVERRDRGYAFRDLGSRNGTLLNQIPASEGALRHEDVLTVGRIRITFLAPDLPLHSSGSTGIEDVAASPQQEGDPRGLGGEPSRGEQAVRPALAPDPQDGGETSRLESPDDPSLAASSEGSPGAPSGTSPTGTDTSPSHRPHQPGAGVDPDSALKRNEEPGGKAPPRGSRSFVPTLFIVACVALGLGIGLGIGLGTANRQPPAASQDAGAPGNPAPLSSALRTELDTESARANEPESRETSDASAVPSDASSNPQDGSVSEIWAARELPPVPRPPLPGLVASPAGPYGSGEEARRVVFRMYYDRLERPPTRAEASELDGLEHGDVWRHVERLAAARAPRLRVSIREPFETFLGRAPTSREVEIVEQWSPAQIAALGLWLTATEAYRAPRTRRPKDLRQLAAGLIVDLRDSPPASREELALVEQAALEHEELEPIARLLSAGVEEEPFVDPTDIEALEAEVFRFTLRSPEGSRIVELRKLLGDSPRSWTRLRQSLVLTETYRTY